MPRAAGSRDTQATMAAPDELEAALVSLDGVAGAAVVAVELGDVGNRLVAYVAPTAGATLNGWEVRRDVALVVPPAVLPATVVVLDALPRGARGTIDRAALPPAPGLAPWRPPTRTERELIEVFAEVLAVDVVGPDDDFFALGGDSLAAVELVTALSDRLGVEVSLSVVIDAPTPARLASCLGTRRPRDASVLVPLQTKGAGPPLVCVAGGGAPAMSLRALSAAMGRFGRHARPFVAVQARGLEERAWPDRSTGAMARRAARAVRADFGTGPVFIGGYSSGGQVAFEVARQLVASGVDVRGLVLIDSPVTWGPGGTRARARRQISGAPPSGGTAHRASPIRRLARVARAGSRHGARRARMATAGVIPRRGLAQYDLFYDLHRECSLRYHPSGAFDGPTVVVRFTGPDRIVPDADPDLGWSSWITGPVTVVELPGKHVEMLRAPGVSKLGAALRTALADLDPA